MSRRKEGMEPCRSPEPVRSRPTRDRRTTSPELCGSTRSSQYVNRGGSPPGVSHSSRARESAPPTAAAQTQIANAMKLRLKVKDKEITVTLIDSETTRDFVSLLPLTLTMDDLFGREKFGHLPRAIYQGGKRTQTYEVGDVVYWSPGPDVAIFYRHDGQPIPSPGIIVIGKMDSGVEALAV